MNSFRLLFIFYYFVLYSYSIVSFFSFIYWRILRLGLHLDGVGRGAVEEKTQKSTQLLACDLALKNQKVW